VHFLNDVKEGQMELRTCGAITNKFMRSRVYPCTNSFVVAGTNYQCEVCADRDEFKTGTLAIATNGVWLWIDRKRGAIPLVGRLFPPGV
jgi:hypothetical protein